MATASHQWRTSPAEIHVRARSSFSDGLRHSSRVLHGSPFDMVPFAPHAVRLPRGAPPRGLRYRKGCLQSSGAVTLEPEPGHAGVGTGVFAIATPVLPET